MGSSTPDHHHPLESYLSVPQTPLPTICSHSVQWGRLRGWAEHVPAGLVKLVPRGVKPAARFLHGSVSTCNAPYVTFLTSAPPVPGPRRLGEGNDGGWVLCLVLLTRTEAERDVPACLLSDSLDISPHQEKKGE